MLKTHDHIHRNLNPIHVKFFPRKKGRTIPGRSSNINTEKTRNTQKAYSLRRRDLSSFKTYQYNSDESSESLRKMQGSIENDPRHSCI
jgi:hypothetical protein